MTSRSSSSLSWSTRSWMAMASGDFGRSLLVRRCVFEAETVPTKGAVGRSLNVGAPDANGRRAQRFVFVLFAAQQCSHRARSRWGSSGFTRNPSAPLRRARRRRVDDRATSERRPVRPRRRTPRCAVPCRWPCRPSCRSAGRGPRGRRRHASTRAMTSGPLATSSMRRSGPSSVVRSSLAQGGEVARQKNNGHWFSVAEQQICLDCWPKAIGENYSCPFAGEWLTCGSGSNRGGATYGDYAFGLD
jgi:hypothetical protein